MKGWEITGMFHKIKTLWHRRDLLNYLVVSDLKVIYKNKVLGFFWSLLDPLLMMLIYVVLVVFIFERGEPQYPVLLFTAILAWKWFTKSLSGAVTSITGNARLIQSVNFPRTILPLVGVSVGLVNYLLGLIVLIPLLFAFEAHFTVNMLWLPVLLVIQLIFTIGAAFFCAALGVYFRDLQNILQFLLRFWFYLSPGLYSIADRIPEQYQTLYLINPFAALFTSYKNVLVLGLPPNIYVLLALAIGVVVLIGGFIFFTRKEAQFAKIV
jgi:lipopolysaccharide transport system permease protein